MAQFVVVLDVTIVAIALPTVREDLGFSEAGLQWVVSAYTLVFGGFLILGGRAADLYGRRRLFALGLGLFAAASLACGLSWSPSSLVAFRIVQGLGAAVVSPSALSLLTTVYPEGDGRGRALGFWTAAAAGGGAAGWVLGGVLTEGLGWEWVFFVNVPVGVLGLALVRAVLPEGREARAARGLDLGGAATVTAGLAILVFGLTNAERAGFAAFSTWGALSASVLFVALFVVVEGRVKDPLVPLGVFRSKDLLGANLAALVLTSATTPPMFLCTLYVQRVLGYPPGEAALLFPPFNLAVVAGSFLGPRMIAAWGHRATMASGLLLVALGAASLMALPAGGAPVLGLLVAFSLMGAGLGWASVASTASGTSSVSAEKQGVASGLLNAAAQVGTALGLAILVPLAAARSGAVASAGEAEAFALVEGYRWAFAGAAGIAAGSAALAVLLARAPRTDEDRNGKAR